MTTFILKKYEESNNTNVTDIDTSEKKEEEDNTIVILGSISEIVAKALQEVLGKNSTEISDQEKESTTAVKTVTTEEINNNPIDSFNSIDKDDIVYIESKGFTTAKEEWFLTNLENKTNKVFFSIPSLAKHLKS